MEREAERRAGEKIYIQMVFSIIIQSFFTNQKSIQFELDPVAGPVFFFLTQKL
ncbi:hypothetical protein [Pallidibacillus pasinlerensis]|uniref:Uncharacterized protein n=1 Tax=Pallidibacillus pasinlerensis TaxID=2703818 RepID=A0ABX0A3J6_9BACI|nr:hypothetical protein [Pallidibacillus pasinlerensis]NCU17951.1 hypothetical protein [Pallidibacillus pasinlerensis]